MRRSLYITVLSRVDLLLFVIVSLARGTTHVRHVASAARHGRPPHPRPLRAVARTPGSLPRSGTVSADRHMAHAAPPARRVRRPHMAARIASCDAV